MQFFNHILSETLSIVSTCCSPFTSCVSRTDKSLSGRPTKPGSPHSSPGLTSQQIDSEKLPMPFLGQHIRQPCQPCLPPTLPIHHELDSRYRHAWDEHGRLRAAICAKEKSPRKRFSSSIRNFSVRKYKDSKSRNRPYISAPSNFQHLHHDTVESVTSLQQTTQAPNTVRPSSFHPLELSIAMSHQQLSPILPLFESHNQTNIQRPSPVYTHWGKRPSDDATLVHQNSSSDASAHLRRGTADSLSSSAGSDETPIPPPKSKARARAYTSPNTERILERIASAMIEKEKLQQQIDNIIERQSVYLNSRPSTAYGIHGECCSHGGVLGTWSIDFFPIEEIVSMGWGLVITGRERSG